MGPDDDNITLKSETKEKFPFNFIPQQVETSDFDDCATRTDLFPFNCVSQQVGTIEDKSPIDKDELTFPFNCVPQQVGT